MGEFNPENLIYYEQQVNDRQGTSAAPQIRAEYLPENASPVTLPWKVISKEKISVFSTDSRISKYFHQELLESDRVLLPVHPMDEKHYCADKVAQSGKIEFSASYRTVFYEPERGGLFADLIGDDEVLMLKLHLVEPLPGIPGDRRLTRQIIDRCVSLSNVLGKEVGRDPMAEQLEIIPEFFGMTDGETGVLLRLLPRIGLVPLFSLYSGDSRNRHRPPLIVERVREIFGNDSNRAARLMGTMLARPLVRSLLAGFRAGISLEMHAQNTLVQLGDDELISRVYFRDIEGVVLFNDYRIAHGLEPLFLDSEFADSLDPKASIHRLYNRNLDHDLGRIFAGSLVALQEYGFLTDHEVRIATQSIKTATAEAVKEGEMDKMGRLGRLLPFSRAPWGNGLRFGHYFRSRFR